MDISTFAVIFAALAAGAVVKGATGMGLPLIALPVLTAFFGLTHAVGLMVVPVLFSNVWQAFRLREARRAAGLGFMPLFLVGVTAGVIGGTWLLKTLPERLLVFTLGVILVIYVVIRIVRPAMTVGAELARRVGLPVGLAAGILNGATGISAPVGVTFIHWMKLERDAHIFAVSAMFLVMGAVQLPAMLAAGIMDPWWLVEGLFALVPIFLFMPVGRMIAARMSREAFDRLILVFLGLIGIKMLAGI